MKKRKIRLQPARKLPSYSQLCAELGYEEGEGPPVETYALDKGTVLDKELLNDPLALGKYLVEQEEKKKKSAGRPPSSGQMSAERGCGEGEVPRVEAHSLDNSVDAFQLEILERLTKYLAEQEDKNKKPAGRPPSSGQMSAERGYGEGEVPLVETYSLDGVDRSQFNSQEELVKYLVEREKKKKKR